MTVDLAPILSTKVIGVVAFALCALLLHGSLTLFRKRVPARWICGLGALRLLAVLLFTLALLRPLLTRGRTVERKPELLVLLDCSPSMRDADATPGGRLHDVLREMQRAGLDDVLERDFESHWFAVADAARPIAPGVPDEVPRLGTTTRLAKSLADAWDYYRHTDDDTAGHGPPDVVLVSDGSDRDSRDVVDLARDLGLKIHTLAPPGQPAAVPAAQLQIVSAQGPQRVLLGSECRFRVVIRGEGVSDLPLQLALMADGEVVATRPCQFAAGQREVTVEVVHRPTTVGLKTCRFSVGPQQDDKQVPAGDPYEMLVAVVGATHKVLHLEDAWRWQSKYLRRLLEDDPNFSMISFVSRGSGAYMQFAEQDNSIKLGGFPQSRAELEGFDIFILGDVDPRRWPPALAPAIHELVVDRGRSLIVIAGPGIMRLAASPLLGPLLPVEISADTGRPVAGPLNAQPSSEARDAPWFFSADVARQADPWRQLPAFDQIYAPTRKKPGATILLECAERRNAFGNLIVMAEHTVGRGHVLFIGTDVLWQWQMLGKANDAGNSPYSLFWLQALRALAPYRPAVSGTKLWLETDRSRYQATQTVRVNIEYEHADAPAAMTLAATVEMPDERRLPLAVTPDRRRPALYHAEFEVPAAGRYRIDAELFAAGKSVADLTTVMDVDALPAEDLGTVDVRQLERIARGTGGRAIDLHDHATWPDHDAAATVSVVRQSTADLWHNFALLALLLVVLALDWLLRLLRGFI